MATADVKIELTCCICTEIYSDPLTLVCGHTYCRLCITRTWDNQEEREFSCPECRYRFTRRPVLERSLALCSIAESFQSSHLNPEEGRIPCTYCAYAPLLAVKTCLNCEASLCDKHLKKHSKSTEHVLTEPTTTFGNTKCSVHKRFLEYYCCEDNVCICVSCKLDGEHRRHQVKAVNIASKKKKIKLKNFLEKLTSKRRDVEKTVQSLHELRREMQEKASGITGQSTAMIRDIRRHLEALENRLLSEISKQEKQISLRISDLTRQLEIKKEELSEKIRLLEELCLTSNPLTVLQERESERKDFCVEIDTENVMKVRDSRHLDVGLFLATLHSGLADIFTTVRRWHHDPEAEDHSLRADTTTGLVSDGATALEYLTVSDSENNNNSKPHLTQAISTKNFSTGSHYLDVEISDSKNWMVGMAYPSINRKSLKIMNISWGFGKLNNECFVKSDSRETMVSYNPSCQRYGIYLDYEAGRLTFYELCDPIRQLYTFTTTFTEPLHVFFSVRDKGSVKIKN